MNLRIFDGEKIIKEGSAGKTTLFNSQGGKLIVTSQRILFIGHGHNFGNDLLILKHEDILYYTKAFTFVIFFPIPLPTAIRLVTKQGKKYKFNVYGRSEWIKAISRVI